MVKYLKIFLFAFTLFAVGRAGAQAIPVLAPGVGSVGASMEGVWHPTGRYCVFVNGNAVLAYTQHNFLLYNTYQPGCIIGDIGFSPGGKYLFVSTGYDATIDECVKTTVYDFYTGQKIMETQQMVMFMPGAEEEIILVNEAKTPVVYTVFDLKQNKKAEKKMPFSVNDYFTIGSKKPYTHDASEHTRYLRNAINAYFLVEQGSGYFGLFLSKKGEELFNAAGLLSDSTEYTGIKSGNGHVFVFRKGRKRIAVNIATGKYENICTACAIENNIVDNHWVVFKDSNERYGLYNLEKSKAWPALEVHQLVKKPGDRINFEGQYAEVEGKRIVCSMDAKIAYETDIQHTSNFRMYNHFPNVYMLDQLTWNIDDPRQFFTSPDEYAWAKLPSNKKINPQVSFEPFPEEEKELAFYQMFDHRFLKEPTYRHLGRERYDPIYARADAGQLYFYNEQWAKNRVKSDSTIYLQRTIHAADRKTTDSLLQAGYQQTGDSTFTYTEYEYQYREFHYTLDRAYIDTITRKEALYRKTIQTRFGCKSLSDLNKAFPLSLMDGYGNDIRKTEWKEPFQPTDNSFHSWLYLPGSEWAFYNKDKRTFTIRDAIIVNALAHPSTQAFGYNIYLLGAEEMTNINDARKHPELFGRIVEAYRYEINIPTTTERIMSINWGKGYFKLKDKKLNTLVTGIVKKDLGFILLTPDNYYYTTKSFAGHISFRHQEEAYDFGQFDLKYNRPDIVLSRIGCKDSLLISTLHKAYLKRLKKSGFTEEMLKDDFHVPAIDIENKRDLPTHTDSPVLELGLRMSDTKYKLDRVNVYLNNVPVYGASGLDLRGDNAQVGTKKIALSLAEGQNRIQVAVLNQAGAESYKETIEITYSPKENKKPSLYLVTIGDSKYRDSRFDLTYAAKDAEDIRSAFEKNTVYGKVLTYHFTNENVTREKIMTLKKELEKAQRDDVVMITVAGHGVLDKDLNYYLATYEMDFNDPAAKGLAYEELESLLDGIAPLKKVLLLDACHSGEVDKEEVEQLAMGTVSNEGVKFRSAGAGWQKKKLGLKTTSELMNELFTDLRRGTGATVISSAGGVEYAMESDQWKNGLFTYCLLHGLKDRAADANGDGQVMLSELQQYLRTEVTQLSKGAQQPSSRIENLGMDFRIW